MQKHDRSTCSKRIKYIMFVVLLKKSLMEKLDETDMLQVFLTNRQGQLGFHCLILDLKTSNDLLLFMALETKGHILGAE